MIFVWKDAITAPLVAIVFRVSCLKMSTGMVPVMGASNYSAVLSVGSFMRALDALLSDVAGTFVVKSSVMIVAVALGSVALVFGLYSLVT